MTTVEDAFASLTAAADKLTVALANASGHVAATTKALLDWDPLEHPRDVYGMFVKKGTGTFLYGKTKKAKFASKTGTATIEYTLGPGDSLYKTPSGNHAVIHPDGSLNFIGKDGSDSFFPAGTETALGYVNDAQDGTLSLVDYSPAVQVKGANEAEAQKDLDNKALALADAYAATDNHIGESGGLSEGAVGYTAEGDPGYLIKHEGHVYYYPTAQTQPGEAEEWSPNDPKIEKFVYAVNAHHDKAKAEAIKNAVLEGPPLAEWEKELLKGADEVKAPKASSMIAFKGYNFYPGSKFYEHNKTANSYLVVEPNASWKIDKTGKKISGAQAVQYLHNYHDITPTVVPEGTPAPAADDYSLVGHHGVGMPPKPKVTPADVKGKTPAEVAAVAEGSFYKNGDSSATYFIPSDKSFYAVAHKGTGKFSYVGGGTDLAGNLAIIQKFDPFVPFGATAKATPPLPDGPPDLDLAKEWGDALALMPKGSALHKTLTFDDHYALPPDHSYYVYKTSGGDFAAETPEGSSPEAWQANIDTILMGAPVFGESITSWSDAAVHFPKGGSFHMSPKGAPSESHVAYVAPDDEWYVWNHDGKWVVASKKSASTYGSLSQYLADVAKIKSGNTVFAHLTEVAGKPTLKTTAWPTPDQSPASLPDEVKKQATLDALPDDSLIIDTGVGHGFAAKTGDVYALYNQKGETVDTKAGLANDLAPSLFSGLMDPEKMLDGTTFYFKGSEDTHVTAEAAKQVLTKAPYNSDVVFTKTPGGMPVFASKVANDYALYTSHASKVPVKKTFAKETFENPLAYPLGKGTGGVATKTPPLKKAAAAPKAAAVPTAAEVTSHLAAQAQLHYPHPSGIEMTLGPGDKLYQHNKVPESFLVVYADGSATKYDKTGKVLSGAQAVQYLHNYTDITWQASNYTLANPLGGTAPAKKITKKAAALAQKVDSGVEAVGKVLAGSKVYQSINSSTVWLVHKPDGSFTRYEKLMPSGYVKKEDHPVGWIATENIAKYWAPVAPTQQPTPQPTSKPSVPVVVDFLNGYVLQPGDKVYKYGNSSSPDYEVVTKNGDYVASFKHFDPATNTASGKTLQVSEAWQQNGKWAAFLEESAAKGDSANFKTVLVAEGKGPLAPLWDTWKFSTPEMKKFFASLPGGWQFIDNGPEKTGTAWDPSTDTYYGVYTNGELTDPAHSETFKVSFLEEKEKALYLYDDTAYPHYFIKPKDEPAAPVVETLTLVAPEVAPKSFSAASVKVTSSTNWDVGSGPVEGWGTVDHTDGSYNSYFIAQVPGVAGWSVWSTGYNNHQKLESGFKTLKDAKYWVSQNAAHKPYVPEPPDPNAPETTTVELNGLKVYLPPGSSVWSMAPSSDKPSYYVFTPYRQHNVEVSATGLVSNGWMEYKDFIANYGGTDKAVKVAETASPEYTLPTPDAVDLGDDAFKEKWDVRDAALSTALSQVDWDSGTPTANIQALSKAILLMQVYRESTSGSEKSKATKTIRALTSALAVAHYDKHRAEGTPVPSGLTSYLLNLPGGSDIFKGTDVYWVIRNDTNVHVNKVRQGLKDDYLVQSAKAVSGKDVSLAFLKGAADAESGFTIDEAKQFLTQQGFEYSDGVTEANVAPLLRTFLTAAPTNGYAAAAKAAQKTLQYASAFTAYTKWQAEQAAAKKPTKGSKKKAAKAKIDWVKAQADRAAKMKDLRDAYTAQFPDGITYSVPDLNAQAQWVNDNADLDFTVPTATGTYSWATRAGIVAALTGNPLYAALAQTDNYDDAYQINTPSWEAFAAWMKSRPWYEGLAASADEPPDAWLVQKALTDFGLDVVPGLEEKQTFKATLMSRVVLSAEHVATASSSIDISAKKHLGVKVADPTVMPAEKPEWANEYSWAVVGLVLGGQPFDMDPAIKTVDLGSAYKQLQQTESPTGQTIPLYKWSEFPIDDPKIADLVRFSRGQAYTDTDPVRAGTRAVLSYLASLGYWEQPTAVQKVFNLNGMDYTATLLPGDTVHKVNTNELAVVHQSGAVYRIVASYGSVKEWAVDHDYWADYSGKPVVWTQPVIVDKEYAAAHGFGAETFDAYMKAKAAPYASLDYPGMAGVSKGESLVFMKKHLASHPKYQPLVDKMPSMPEGTLKYLHYSAKAGLEDPFDFALLLNGLGQFDPQEMPNLTVYKTPNGAPWAEQMAKFGAGVDEIYASWGDALAAATYATVLGKSTNSPNYIEWDEAKELSDVLLGNVLWTDPNASSKKADKASKGTLVFTEVTGKSLGGMHTKYLWADQYGNEWMSKAFASDPQAKARVDAEHYACEISRLFGYGAPESRIQKMKGDYAYVQYLAPSPGDFTGTNWHDLPLDLTAKVMTEHILDWIVSNHDTHEKNLMFTPEKDDFFGIDKGQAFKFFPNDQLAEGYLPPGNPDPAWYDHIYKAIRTKSIPKDDADKVVDTVLRKAAYVSVRHNDAYRQMLEGAFQNRTNFPYPVDSREKFIDALMQRKASVFEDFEALYKGLYQQAGWEWPGKTKDEYLPKKIGSAHVAITPDFAADVMASKTAGQSLFFAGPDLEDGHLLFYTTLAPDKTTVLRAEGKLRADADKVFATWLQQHTIEKVSSSSLSSYQPTKPDYSTLYGITEAYTALQNYVMTVNHHAEDKEYNASTVATAHQQRDTLKQSIKAVEDQIEADPLVMASVYNHKFVTAEQQASWLAAAKQLVSQFEQVDEAHTAQVKSPFNKVDNPLSLPSYTPSPGLDTSGKPKALAAYKVQDNTFYKWSDGNYVKMVDGKYTISDSGEFTNATHVGTEVSVGDGEDEPFVGEEVEASGVSVANKVVSVKHQSASTYSGAYDPTVQEFVQTDDSGGYGMSGMEYEISYDNIKVKYMPWHGSDVKVSQQGLLRLEVTGWEGGTPEIEEMLTVLRDTGLSLNEADETDLEILYWRRQAGLMGDRSDKNQTKNKAVLDAVAKIQGMESKVAERDALREAFTLYYGADGVAKAVADKVYLPVFGGLRASPDNTQVSGVGKPLWERPHIESMAQIKEWAHGYLPRHSTVAWGGGYGSEKASRMRSIVLSGALMSTEERTRVVGWLSGMSSDEDQSKGSSAFNFFRQKQDYQNWDVVAEPHIYYRDSNYAFNYDHYGALDYRASEGKYAIEDTIKHGGDELMLKNAVSMMSDVAFVVIPDWDLRQELIATYKALGITEIRGIPIEERFVGSTSEATQTAKKVWKQAIDAEKEGGAA